MRQVKEAIGDAHLKVILETGELGTYDNVRRASLLAIAGGADFIKTSTGKISPAATLPVTLVMLEAARDVYEETGRKVGVKAAGGIREAKDAVRHLVLVNETLGPEWLTPDLFRFGASTLLNDLLLQIRKQKTGRLPEPGLLHARLVGRQRGDDDDRDERGQDHEACKPEPVLPSGHLSDASPARPALVASAPWRRRTSASPTRSSPPARRDAGGVVRAPRRVGRGGAPPEDRAPLSDGPRRRSMLAREPSACRMPPRPSGCAASGASGSAISEVALEE